MQAEIRTVDQSAEYFFDEGCHILELSNDPDDPDLSIARARVTAGGTTHWHRLDGVAERYVVIAGEGEVELGDGTRGRLGAGDVVRIPSGMPQRIRNTGSGDLLFLALCTPRFTPAAYVDLEPPSP